MLTVKEVATLKGCSERYIRSEIKKGNIRAVECENPANNRKEYRIDPADLDEKLKLKYYAGLGIEISGCAGQNSDGKKSRARKEHKGDYLGDCTEEERQTIALWCDILARWQEARGVYGLTKELDDEFITAEKFRLRKEGIQLDVSRQILYRKYSYYKEKDYVNLLDDRGAWNKGQSCISDEVWQAFLWFYHDDRQPCFTKSYQDTLTWTEKFYPQFAANFPSEASFRRRYKAQIPKVITTLMRKGEKSMTDECLQYIERTYDDLCANDVWVADNHTLDVLTKYDDGTERTHRLSLTAFMDAKSGVITGWNLTDNPCSQSTIFALRMGILKFGVPKEILFDNGREFTVKDIGGKGNRRRKSDEWHEVPPTILNQLGIVARWAKVQNARAKHIERFFLNFKNNISKNFSSYIGGNILERPESVKKRLKNGEITTDSELRAVMDDLIDYENMAPYGGAEKRKYRNYSKLEVWNEEIDQTKHRICKEENLEFLLMRTSGYQKVKRKGVFITIAGEKIWYSGHKTVWLLDKEVYVRYDPTNLAKVRVYDKDDRYLDTWNADIELVLRFFDDKDAVKDANAKLAAQKKMVKDYAKSLSDGLPAHTKIDILALSVERAQKRKKEMFIKQGAVIEPIRIGKEEPQDLLKRREVRTGTDNVVSIDIARMNANLAKRKGLE